MDINFNEEVIDTKPTEKIVISKQQRNGRKCWTIIEHFTDDKDPGDIKKFIKHVKKTKCCNGSYQSETKTIQFQGDCVDFIKEILVSKYELSEEEIVIKGV